MNLFRKLVATLVSCCFLMGTTIAKADVPTTSTSTVGSFTIIQKGQTAPFDGVLFDPTATAIILTDKDQAQEQFKLKLQYELDKQKADLHLNLQNLQLSLDITKKTSEEIIAAKDKELKEVRDIAVTKNDNTWLYIAGGTVAGIALTLLTLFVAKKADQ